MMEQIPSTSLEQRQTQVLAPQLLQSLEMLQAPILELRALVQQELLRNPTLEERIAETPGEKPDPVERDPEDQKELSFKEDFETLSRLDEESRSYFMQNLSDDQPGSDRGKKRAFMLDSQVKPESLQEHLRAQLRVAGLDGPDAEIGELIIGNINEDGYLLCGLEEIASSGGFDPARVEDVLAAVQEFNPVGVGARDASECLLLQLERMGQGNYPAPAMVRGHLDLLALGRLDEIARLLPAPIEEVRRAAKIISTLDPKPGRAFSAELPLYVTPDVAVEKNISGYSVMLNDEHLPRLRISRRYKEMLESGKLNSEAEEYIRSRIRSGLFVIRSVARRQQTIRKVASEIVRIQEGFLDSGPSQLKPLTMSELAGLIGLHETTVCRCVANKYMKTPRGLFEMRYFFSPGLKTSDGSSVSSRAVQEKIHTMIKGEDPAHPLSDQEISGRLASQGLSVARRTVAKYRMMLKKPPAHLRRLR